MRIVRVIDEKTRRKLHRKMREHMKDQIFIPQPTIVESFMASIPFVTGVFYAIVVSIITWVCSFFKMKKNIKGDTVLITGASRGIGLSIARELAKFKPKAIILWSRNEEELQSVAEEIQSNYNVECRYMTCDISNTNDIHEKAEIVKTDFGGVDILVNNAGYINGFPILESEDSEMCKTIYTNALGHIWTIKAFLPGMFSKDHGRIVCVNSTLGLMGLPGAGDYVASKFALRGFTDALRIELEHKKKNIKILDVHPYLVNTGMFEGCQTRFPWLFPALEVDYVAQQTVRAMRYEKHTLILPKYMRLLFILKSLLPTTAWVEIQKFFHIHKSMDNFYKRT